MRPATALTAVSSLLLRDVSAGEMAGALPPGGSGDPGGFAGLPAWAVMWGLAVLIFAGCKVLTLVDAHEARRAAGAGRLVGYLLAWPGLDARTFLGCGSPDPVGAREWCLAAARLATGLALLGCLRWLPADRDLPYVTGWVGMVGLVLVLHLTTWWLTAGYHLLSCLFLAFTLVYGFAALG